MGEPDGGGATLFDRGIAVLVEITECYRMDQTTPLASKMLPPLVAARQGRDVFRLTNGAVAVGSIFFTIAAALAWQMFRPHVPAAIMQIWVGGTAAFMISWYILCTIFLIRQPGELERETTWFPAQIYVRIGSNLVVLATVWLFYPYAPRDLQLVMTVFYVAHVPTQILALPQRGLINAAGTAIMMGSVAAVQLIHGGSYAMVIALFVIAFAAVMILLGQIEGTTISDVLFERRKSEEATRQLELALAAVAAERDAKTRFIATASHDLSHPLQAASLFFDQALRAPDPAHREQAAEGVRSAFAAADQLLSHMLNHLRLEADAVEPHLTRLALAPVMTRIAAQFGPAATDAGIIIKGMPTRALVEADRALLERALGNLVDNAIKHSGATRIILCPRRSGRGALRIWVLDDGKGVAGIDADQLFDDYFRGAATGSTSGFGLGLSSVRRLAALLHGSAGFDLRWRSGAAFYLELPATEALAP
jgi:signal transduction histidine kinase